MTQLTQATRMEVSDADLVDMVLGGNDDAFTALYDRHIQPLTAWLVRKTGDYQRSEDIAQNAVFKAYTNLATFDEERAFFKTWLTSIARCEMIDDGRRSQRNALTHASTGQATDEYDPTVSLKASDDTVKAVEFNELNAVVAELLETIPADQREAFVKNHFEGVTIADIAADTGTSTATIKSRSRLTREKLGESLSRLGFGVN